MKKNQTLIYVHDPMCSWCYGFKPTLKAILNEIEDLVKIKFLLGGLAADTNNTMPTSQQENIKSNWYRIENSIPNTKFNYDFWDLCTPRRSTYPSCRAVISAAKQHLKYEVPMIEAIQNAYYLNAKNPSNYNVLYTLADNIRLNKALFINDLHSEKIDLILHEQIKLCRNIGADSFPSLYLLKNKNYHPIVIDYQCADASINHIKSYIEL